MSGAVAAREFGDGVLARGAAAVYHVLVLEALLLLTAAPGLVLLALLVPDATNAPLVAAALVPIGPALSATVFAWRACLARPGLEPARHFWRGYWVNAVDVLRWWVPALALLAVLSTNLAHVDAVAAAPVARTALAAALVVLLAGTALWTVHALVLTSLFAFRTRDVVRLGLHHLTRRPAGTLGAASLLVLAAGTVAVTSDWVLAGLGSVFALLLLHNARAMIADVEENHTA